MIGDLRSLSANIPEKDIPFVHAIHVGGTQEVRINAYPKDVFKGTIAYVADVLILSRVPCSSELNCPIGMGTAGNVRHDSTLFPTHSPIDWRCRKPRCNAIRDALSSSATRRKRV